VRLAPQRYWPSAQCFHYTRYFRTLTVATRMPDNPPIHLLLFSRNLTDRVGRLSVRRLPLLPTIVTRCFLATAAWQSAIAYVNPRRVMPCAGCISQIDSRFPSSGHPSRHFETLWGTRGPFVPRPRILLRRSPGCSGAAGEVDCHLVGPIPLAAGGGLRSLPSSFSRSSLGRSAPRTRNFP
jgi:hypothetical protein